MNKYEVTRTSLSWQDEIPCRVVPCELYNIVKKYASYEFHEYHYIIHADSLDNAIMMLRKEFDEGKFFEFVIMKSNIDDVDYCIEIYDDYREQKEYKYVILCRSLIIT